jgi:HK97 family phage portal protein
VAGLSRKRKQRDAPIVNKRTDSGLLWLSSPDSYSWLTSNGYSRLVDTPEIQTAANRIADLISSMTIHLMANTKDGDQRIKNELSRKIDVSPNKWTTRKQWMFSIVRNILLDGEGNAVQIPHFAANGFLDDLEPMDMTKVQFSSHGYGYSVSYGGRPFNPDEVLHFIANPDPQKPWLGKGYRVLLTDLAGTLRQAQTTRTEFMNNPTPSIIVRVDALTEEFASSAGRDQLLQQYFQAVENGKPWLIPAELADIQQVKPMSISDLAIKDSIAIDKRTAAAIFGVPAFLVGEGKFDRDEYNSFVSTIVLPIARGIEQELTRKLLLSPDWYFRFNPRSLFSYSLTEISEVACNYVDRAIIDRNEARDWSGWNPREGLSELAILENYVPYAKIGDQKKLVQKGGDDANG